MYMYVFIKSVVEAIVIDGHMKGTRSVCGATEVKTIDSEELGSIQIGCWKMPMKGSIYFTGHKHVKEEQKKLLPIYFNITLIDKRGN